MAIDDGSRCNKPPHNIQVRAGHAHRLHYADDEDSIVLDLLVKLAVLRATRETTATVKIWTIAVESREVGDSLSESFLNASSIVILPMNLSVVATFGVNW